MTMRSPPTLSPATPDSKRPSPPGDSDAPERPFPTRPTFEDDELAAVTDVIRSGKVNYWTGPHGERFEREFAEWVGLPTAIALANGTVALEGALRALGVGPGDDVVVTPRTFLASASCVVAVGARPVFADIDPDSGNITPATVERALTPNTRAVIAVHLAGWPCDMDGLMALASARGFAVIEDCAQSLGARVDSRATGSMGHIGAFSFCQDKIMTTLGEGGMVTTANRDLWSHMWFYKDHGKSWSAVKEREHPPGFRWLHESFGTNWRMTEVQSAQGRVALRKVNGWVARRREHAHRLFQGLGDLSALRIPAPPAHLFHSYYKFYVYVRPETLGAGWDRDRIMQEIGAAGVPCFSGSCSEIYLERAFDGLPSRPTHHLPVARSLGEASLMFLVHPTLRDDDISRVVDAARGVIGRATR